MKHIFLSVGILLTVQLSNAQNHYEVYLKNGTVMRGTILQQADGTTKFRTDEGGILLLPAEEIRKFKNLRKREKEAYPVRDGMRKWERKILAGFSLCTDLPLLSLKRNYYEDYPGYYQFTPGGGFAGGLSFAMYRGPIGFETGIFYRTEGLSYISSNPYYYEQTNTYPNSWITGTEAPLKQSSRYHSVGFPFALDLLSVGKKVRFFASFGFSADLTILYAYTNNYEGNYHYYFLKGYPGFESSIGSNSTLNGHPLDTEDHVGNFDQGVNFQVLAGVEANLSPNSFIRVGPLFYGGAGSLGGGINFQVLFNAQRKRG